MSNMAHCRFENTFHDLKDCMYALEEKGWPRGQYEAEYGPKLVDLCRDIVDWADENERDESQDWTRDEDDQDDHEQANRRTKEETA